MKKVFLSLAVIAALTVVSCKQAEEAPAEEVVTEEVAPVAEEAVAADSTAVAADSTAAPAAAEAAAPATEEKK